MDKRVRKTLLFTVIILVTILSLMPLHKLEIKAPLGTDKAIHIIMYFMITILALWSYSNGNGQTLKIVIIVILYGILIEVLQECMPLKRTGDIYDVIANTIGSFLGMISQPIIKKIEKSFL
ncbi:MAG: VanZ family protein [Flavobacteriales bacterium]